MTLLNRLLVVILLVTSITAALGAGAQTPPQDIEARIRALTPEDTRDLLLKAQAGDAAAQYMLGRAYKRGYGVARSDGEGINWLRQAAAQSYAPAEMQLANIYFQGDGVAKDETEGMKWLKKAAQHGDSMAQFTLGYSLELGGNASEAASWYRKAAEQGLALAQTALGFVYEQGKGVRQDS